MVGSHLGFSVFFQFLSILHFFCFFRLCVPNFVMNRLTVKKLLVFLFSIGNALKVLKNWGFGDFWSENWNMHVSEPHLARPRAKIRILMYYSSKTVHRFDQGAIPRNTKNNDFGGHLGFRFFWFLSIWLIWGSALDSACQISQWSDFRFNSY